ncbi:entericidin A/B family lipoprotein [Thioclava sp. GXIMD4216]|uniref:Entericidin A/B family lipoprotein n=1 Tax=Thioclava litoralis TaxID=3076557 RepID=A0ABZ1DYH0_9RHOB|nr:entericidin A/B family lipoprotein [Thioclava sp. FTW29]
MTKRIFPALILVAVSALSACSTVHGFGQDVSTAGHVVQREAVEAQR